MNTEAAILQVFEKMPENLKQELLHYAEYLVQNQSLENFQEQLGEPHGYGSWAGKIIMSDDFDAYPVKRLW